jgi:hypothetical protein
VSVPDAHRATTAGAASGKNVDHIARDRRRESPGVHAVDGGVGIGKTAFLLLAAHDRRDRCKFHYVLLLGLVKDATEANILADIADLVDISSGEALATKTRAVPAREHQVQNVVHLTRSWLAKTGVLLLPDYIWLRKGSRSWAGEVVPLCKMRAVPLFCPLEMNELPSARIHENTFLLGFGRMIRTHKASWSSTQGSVDVKVNGRRCEKVSGCHLVYLPYLQ